MKSTTLLLCFVGAALLSPQAAKPAPQLALLTSTSTRAHGYDVVSGDVQNISGEPLKGIVVSVTWYDKDRRFVATNIGLLKDEPLAPKQRTTYGVSAHTKPAMASYSVTFKGIRDNAVIPIEDRRPQKR